MIDIVRMMAVYNEVDILPCNIDWYHRAGIRTVVVDNGSTDGSYEYCMGALARGELDYVERLVTDEFEWRTLLARLYEVALRQHPQWLMLASPDEFFETANGDGLLRALNEDAEAGYNLIKFYNMEFWMTPLDDAADPNPLTRMRYYSCYDVEMYRCYPNVGDIDLVSEFGHRPRFSPSMVERVSPRLYVSRHYKLRNVEQARRKISRIRPNQEEPDAHTHYLLYRGPADAIVSPDRLHHYDFDRRWNFESTYDGGRGRPRTTRLPPS